MMELGELLKKSIVFDFNGYYRTTFNLVKAVIADHHTLCLYDKSKELVLEADASQKGLATCLLQEERHIF